MSDFSSNSDASNIVKDFYQTECVSREQQNNLELWNLKSIDKDRRHKEYSSRFYSKYSFISLFRNAPRRN